MKKVISILFSFSLFISAIHAQNAWFKAQHKEAKIQSVVATSELVEAHFKGRYLYSPVNILDGNFDNTWCEATPGSGIGESITVEFEKPVSFDEIQIVNGFASKNLYNLNNRIKTITLTQVAKKHFQQKQYTLTDNTPTWQSIKFDLLQTAQTITIKIDEVYKGTLHDDTCLDDIRLLYKGKVIPFTGIEEIRKIQEENSKLMLQSSTEEFEKQFYELFKDGDTLFLKSQIDDRDIVIEKYEHNGKNYISSIDQDTKALINKGSKDEILKQIKKYENYHIYLANFESNLKDLKTTANAKYICIQKFFPDYFFESHYSLGKFKILKTERVDYVETTTAIMIAIKDKTLFWNGVPYTILTEKEVDNFSFYNK